MTEISGEQCPSTPEEPFHFSDPLESPLRQLLISSSRELTHLYHRGIIQYLRSQSNDPICRPNLSSLDRLGDEYRDSYGLLLRLHVCEGVKLARDSGLTDEQIMAFAEDRLAAIDAIYAGQQADLDSSRECIRHQFGSPGLQLD